MFRPTTARLAAAPLRSSRLAARPITLRHAQVTRVRFNSSAPPPPPPQGGAPNQSNHTAIILAAIAALGAGGYYLLKPVSDVAGATHGAIKTVKEGGSDLTEHISGIAKATLPPSAFAIYQTAIKNTGGFDSIITALKEQDLKGVFDEIKKNGGDDVKRIAAKVEQSFDDAKGDLSKLDYKKLIAELKSELPKDKQQLVDVFVGKLPDAADIDKLVAKAKEVGGDQLKKAEEAASKVLKAVDAAQKEGKGKADAFLTGLKQAAPNDVDDLVKQLKEAAKSAGLPAETIEAWAKSKVEDGKIDAEALGKQFEDKLRTAVKILPGEPRDLVKQVEQVSPSVAKLLQQALDQIEAGKK